MKRLLMNFAFITLVSCTSKERSVHDDWKTIEIGNYLFDCPADFKLIEEQGIDSYVGKIQGDSIIFVFDYGYYSNSLEQTPAEYLENGDWRLTLPYQFMQEGITYDRTNTPEVKVVNIRPARAKDKSNDKACDYIAECKYKEFEFSRPIYLPEVTKQSKFRIDTIDQHYRKMVIAKDHRKGTTGIYMRDLHRLEESGNGSLALSMVTSNISKQQQELAVEIFETSRIKNVKK